MIRHYLKVSFRSLLKYRQQTIISIVGLAIGFVCFALSSLWIWYERSFDTFHPDAERIYKIQVAYQNDNGEKSSFSDWTSYPLAPHLFEVLPDVESSCRVWMYGLTTTFKFAEDKKVDLKSFYVDSGFYQVFGMEPLQKSSDKPFASKGTAAVTDRGLKLFPNDKEYSVGSIIQEDDWNNEDRPYEIVSIVKAWSVHTNMPFDVLMPLFPSIASDWKTGWLHTFIKLRKGVDPAEFQKKLEALRITDHMSLRLTMVPLDEMYYRCTFYNNRNIRYDYIPVFSIAGLLVICSALFNFLALFISRLRMKGKELVLRKVNGALDGQLLKQLIIEVVLVLIFVLLFALLILEWIYPQFETLALIKLPKTSMLTSIGFCFLILLVLTLIASIIPIRYFKSQTLQNTLRDTGLGRNRKYFSKISLSMQCMVGIFFMFCTSVIICQIIYSKNRDLGFDRKNIATVNIGLWADTDLQTFLSEMKKEPTVQDMALAGPMFLPYSGGSYAMFKDKDGRSHTMEKFVINEKKVFDLLGLKLVAGRMPEEGEIGVFLNEAAVLEMGEGHDIGTVTEYGTILGTVKNFQYGHPKGKNIRPAIIIHNPDKKEIERIYVKYRSTTREDIKAKIDTIVKEKLKGRHYSNYFSFMEEEYDQFFKEDNIILGLLSVLALVCISIALFGIYAMVSLSCEQRRKEIAIRKITGASTVLLLKLFIKEYLVILIISAVLIFPVGYMVMKTWVEQYYEQIQMWPVYLVVVVIIVLLMTITITTRIWKTLHANPAKELKRE